MKALLLVSALLFCISGSLLAGEVDVIASDYKATGERIFRFEVTLKHADTGWDH